MNGHAQAATASPLSAPHDMGAQPLITVNQLSLTGAQLRNLVLGVAALLGIGGTGGYLFIPAKQEDLKALTEVVKLVQTEGQQNRDAITRLATENREAVEQLTAAVRAVNETVIDMRTAVEARPDPMPVTAPVVRARPRARPAAAVTPPPPGRLTASP